MTRKNSDVDYADGSVMERGGRYAAESGRVQIHLLPKDKEKRGRSVGASIRWRRAG
ncbi:MAG: hypothetical protein ACLR06_06830 [Christensenellaceae bacterium]